MSRFSIDEWVVVVNYGREEIACFSYKNACDVLDAVKTRLDVHAAYIDNKRTGRSTSHWSAADEPFKRRTLAEELDLAPRYFVKH